MNFEVIRKSHKKEIIIGVSIFIMLAIVLIVKFTFARYSLVKSIKIAEGTINYKVPDFKIMAMYKQKEESTCTEDSCYNEMAENEVMPESGYTINENKSYCELNGSKDNNAKIYTDDNGNHVISKITKGSRCYLYFDKELCSGVACKTILGNVTLNEGIPDFSKIAIIDEGVYKANDNDGASYYFRGAVANNYVKFAGFYWRIIRINGDGSIRMIYQGKNADSMGEDANINVNGKNLFSFNASNNNNAYVGLKYTIGQLRGLGAKSDILKNALEPWYVSNLASYANKIDVNAGFCADRTPYLDEEGTNSGGGTGTTITYYGARARIFHSSSPILTCPNNDDLYTISSSSQGNKSLSYPIGMITADEVAMAGGTKSITNVKFYLYTGKHYWTISPDLYNSVAVVLAVHIAGYFTNCDVSNDSVLGVRPVINLKSDTKFIFTGTGGKGSITNPYIVS